MNKVKRRESLNENDLKILALCNSKPLTPTEIYKIIKIAPKNITARLKKLEQAKLISVEKVGRQKLIKTIDTNKTDKYLKEILDKIKKNGGEMDYFVFFKLLSDFDTAYERIFDDEMENKMRAKYRALLEGYLSQKVVLTEKGKEFIK